MGRFLTLNNFRILFSVCFYFGFTYLLTIPSIIQILSSTKVTRHVLYCHHGKNRRQENRSQEPRGNT